MQLIDPIYTANMNDHQRAWFYAEYEHARRDEVVGILLAVFLGSFGIHQFYIRRNGLGVLYLLFSWTGIPTVLGWIDAFFMPGRVRRYNAEQAAYISAQILSAPAQYTAPTPAAAHECAACGGLIEPSATFCPHCGAATAAGSAQPAV